MEDKKVKKVLVELENGNKMEFAGQVVIFVEEEMSEVEKILTGDEHGKAHGIIQCNPIFLATVTNAVLETLSKRAPGLDLAVMLSHLDDAEKSKPSFNHMEALSSIFCMLNKMTDAK